MKWLKSIFKKKKVDIAPMPPYDEIVKSLYDKELNYTSTICSKYNTDTRGKT